MRNIRSIHRNFWTRDHVGSFVVAIILSAAAIIVQKSANIYVAKVNGIFIGDLILSNIPTVDLDVFIIQGSLALTFVCLFLLIFKPQYVLFTVKALAIFIIIRSFFITLTHLGVDPQQLKFDTNNIGYSLYNYLYNTEGDFFFSAHTGIPFLMMLIFWPEKFWRYFFLAATIIFGASVLFAHIHYSIDVFAAPFMTWGIFSLSKKFFAKDYKHILAVNH